MFYWLLSVLMEMFFLLLLSVYLMQEHLDKIGDEFVMDPSCIKQPSSNSLGGRSVQSLSTGTGYYGQNGGGTMTRDHRRPVNSAALVESHFLSPLSPMDSSSSRHQQPTLNGSATRATMIPEPDVDDLMNDDSDSVSQSSRPGKSSISC